MNITKRRLEALLDERVKVGELQEQILASAEKREDPSLTEPEQETLGGYRQRALEIDSEVEALHSDLQSEQKAEEASRLIRAHMAGEPGGGEVVDGEYKYRTFGAYARDELITRKDYIAQAAGGEAALKAARERLKMRAPEHTLSENVDGLSPPQHIAQIIEVINRSRPVVESANRSILQRGKLTYPKVNSKPTVEDQGTVEKQEGGTTGMDISLEDETAHTFIGGGNLSWQAIEWSTPSALDLWFQMAGADYAKKTETFVADVLGSAAGTIGTALAADGSDTFADWLAVLLAGVGDVLADTDAMPNTIWLSPDMFIMAAALSGVDNAQLITAGQLNLPGLSGTLAGMRVVTSTGFDPGTAIVGSSEALVVAESPNAPVQLRAVEPAIGGLEVGVIGAIAAVSLDDDRFAALGTATY